MLSSTDKNNIINAVQSVPDFADFGIGFEGGDACEIIQEPLMPKGLGSWIIIIEEQIPVSSNQLVITPKAQEPNIGKEWLDMGISCVSAILTGVASGAGVLAAPVTGGGSIAFSVLTWTAAGASALQCGVGIGRVVNAHHAPSSNIMLDNSSSYKGVMYAADGVQLVSDTIGIAGVIKVSGRLIRLGKEGDQLLKKAVQKTITRQERKVLAREMSGAKTPALFKKGVRTGDYKNIINLRNIQWTVAIQLMNVISASLDLLGSARGGNIQYAIKLVSEAEIEN